MVSPAPQLNVIQKLHLDARFTKHMAVANNVAIDQVGLDRLITRLQAQIIDITMLQAHAARSDIDISFLE